MIVTEDILNSVKAHVNSSPKREICGVIVSHKRKNLYIPCVNVSQGENEFIIDAGEFADISDKYKVLAIVHSHVGVNPAPSQADLIAIEKHKLPFLIVNYPLNTWTWTEPTGYVAPYIGRPFVHGVTDCYAMLVDYYKRELKLDIKDYSRQSEWWIKGDNLYLENYEDAGFVKVNDLQKNDIIIMQVASPVPNHCAIYLGDNIILHHVMGRASSRDVYGGYWRKITSLIVRHTSLC